MFKQVLKHKFLHPKAVLLEKTSLKARFISIGALIGYLIGLTGALMQNKFLVDFFGSFIVCGSRTLGCTPIYEMLGPFLLMLPGALLGYIVFRFLYNKSA